MEKVSIDDLENEPRVADIQKHATGPLGLSEVALNYHELEPGESFSGGMHTHMNQEEVFYVIDGTLAFETEAGEVEVGAGEAIRFEPGEFQRSRNAAEGRARVLGIGAPANAGELTLLRECSDCGERTDQEIEPVDDGAALVTRCADCGAETGRFS